MRNLKYIVMALALAFSFTACNMDIPLKDESLPAVDIVERSALLDMVNIDYVLDNETKQMLADSGVSVSMSGFELTADYMAQFKLTFHTANGDYEYKFDTAIDYTQLGDDKFDNIRLYWGDIQPVENGLLIHSLYNYAFLPLDEKADNFTPHHLSFIKDEGGYIVHSAKGFGRYALIYRTADNEGIAVFDTNGKMLSHISSPQVNTGIVGMLGTQTQRLISDIPFSYANQFKGRFASENLFMIEFSDWRIPAGRLYNVAENITTDTVFRFVDVLSSGNTEYSVYEIYVPGGADINVGYFGLALRKENDCYTGAVLYDTKGYYYEAQSTGALSLDGENLVYHSQPTGLQFTINFENDSCEKAYLITENMLSEKLATSKSKEYSLYEYGKHPHNNVNISYLALKNEKTDSIFFVSDYSGAHRQYILEAGFFSNGDIYLLTDYDFEIYTTDTGESGPIFNVGKKFPLGVEKEDGYLYNSLHAVRRDPMDGSFIVVFDHLNNVKQYIDQTLYDDKYEISLLDKDGNLVKTYMTEMQVASVKYALNMYLTGDVLTLQNVDKETGEILQKGTLNIKTGKFTLTKEWRKAD